MLIHILVGVGYYALGMLVTTVGMFFVACYLPGIKLSDTFYNKAIAHIIFWPVFLFKLCVLVIVGLILTLFNLFLLAIK